MKFLLLAAGFMWAGTILAAPVCAQEARQEAKQETREAGPQPPGRAVVLSKCFQCHTDAMFRDQRQDRRAWESTIYRMVGRGLHGNSVLRAEIIGHQLDFLRRPQRAALTFSDGE
jgi:mono/diheme cytochrome c family protein